MCNTVPRHSTGDLIPGPLTVALILARLIWRALVALAIAATVVGWFMTGPQVTRHGRPRRYARRVHAAFRFVGALILIFALANPILTAIVVTATGVTLAGVAAARRRPVRPQRPPVRVRATVRRPVPVTGHTAARRPDWATVDQAGTVRGRS